MLGLACGDALGTSVEFKKRDSFQKVEDMIGGGPFQLRLGQWTDDTSMAFSLAESLIECNSFDPIDQMRRYLKWYKHGYLSSTGVCFDIGNITRFAILAFEKTGNPFSGKTDPGSAGNGCLMRLAPIPMFYFQYPKLAIAQSGESARTTHGALECIEASRIFRGMIHAALHGSTKEKILLDHRSGDIKSIKLKSIANGEYISKHRNDIKGSGYVIESLEAALWCFANTSNYQDAV